MNCFESNCCRWSLWFPSTICALVVTGLMAGPIVAQDFAEIVERHGPNLSIIQRDKVEQALMTWRWRLRLADRQGSMMHQIEEQSQKDLSVVDDQLSEMREALADVGLSLPMDVSMLREIESERRACESQLVGVQARLALQQEQVAADHRELELEMKFKRGELEVVGQQLEVRKQRLDGVRRKVESGLIPQEELVALEVSLAEVEGAYKNVRNEIEALRHRREQVPVELESTAEEQRFLRERLEDIQRKLERIRATDAIQRYEGLQFRRQLAREKLQMSLRRQVELELDNARYEALVMLTEKALSESTKTPKDRAEEAKPADAQ